MVNMVNLHGTLIWMHSCRLQGRQRGQFAITPLATGSAANHCKQRQGCRLQWRSEW
ncbi:MAG TPA: hypothetical protein PKC34_07535 [Pseudomonadales bacterium]|nr:hypothetical protein [Pseudomonadales bacterium]MCP5331913.1 hypothetical protein [Pseudomonadales bacterium]HMU91103.1 hypothetical protein [Pseudomonadales bacterium]HMW15383.1 hypothetical protein [Pseudomonadales bacterium]HMW83587.1 hypothetical protein [Pseudomonadales bacterium]